MPLGFPVVPRRVEDVEQVLAVHRLGRALGRLLRHRLVPPQVALGAHRDVVLGAAQDEHVLDRGGLGDGFVGDVLQRDDGAAPPRAVGGDQHLGFGIVDAVAQRHRGEATEHDGVRRADAGAREERGDGSSGTIPM